jgi:hypothetical protein
MSWENILKNTWYVEDGDAPLHGHVHELLFFMAYNEDPKIKQAGEALLNKFDEYYERVEDKDELNDLYSPEFFSFQKNLKKLAGAVTSKMGLRKQYMYLIEAKRLM